MIRAYACPSGLRPTLSELMFRLYSVTDSMPLDIYFVTVFAAVAGQTPLDLALCS